MKNQNNNIIQASLKPLGLRQIIFVLTMTFGLGITSAHKPAYAASAAPPSTGAKTKLRIMIDPGHGGEDTGTFHSGIKEKDLVLKVAKLLNERVARDTRFEVSLTRSNDQFIPLDDRSKLAEDKKVDLFLSIHANSSPDERARGTEVYFENQTPSDEESMLTAARENGTLKKKEPAEAAPKNDVDHILNDLGRSRHMEWSELYCQTLIETLRKHLGTKGQSIRQAPFRVLSVSMPASLIELGFLTNPKDAAWLSDSKTHVKIADALYASLVAYKEKLDKLKRLPVD